MTRDRIYLIAAAIGGLVALLVFPIVANAEFRRAFGEAWLRIPEPARTSMRDSLLSEEGLTKTDA